MKKIYLYTMFAAAFLASCSDFEPDHSALSNKEISFKVKTNGIKQVGAESRVTPITDDNITNFGVVAFRRASTASIANMAPNFIYDAEVVKTGNRWATAEKQFWPMNSDVLDFYAYAPYHAEGITLSSASATGVPTITYDASSQLDLITATATNQALTVAGTGVPLTFNHALTTIKFEKSDELPGNITSISIKKVYNSGKLTIGGSWSFAGITRSDVAATEGVAMTMIPQQFSDSEQLIEVVYSYQGSNYTLQHQLSGSRWTAGTTLTYEITSTSLLTIKYDNDVVVTPWDNANEVAMAMMIENDEVIIGDFSIGDFLCSDGSVVSPEKLTTSGKTPIAIVFSTETSDKDKANGWTHGYAMALKNVHSNGSTVGTYKWANSNSDVSGIPNTSSSTWQTRSSDMEGRTNTTYINSKAYPAGYAAKTTYASQVTAPSNTSGWFLPSSGQWYNILVKLGGMSATPNQAGGWSTGSSTAASNLNSKLSKVGSGNYDSFSNSNEYYWSSSEGSSSYAYYASFGSTGSMYFASDFYNKSDTGRVRAVIAF